MMCDLKDINGKQIILGDTIGLYYVDPSGKIHYEIDSQKTVIFKHGCYGYMTETRFVPLLNWAPITLGDYIPNEGNIEIVSDKCNFIKIEL